MKLFIHDVLGTNENKTDQHGAAGAPGQFGIAIANIETSSAYLRLQEFGLWLMAPVHILIYVTPYINDA